MSENYKSDPDALTVKFEDREFRPPEWPAPGDLVKVKFPPGRVPQGHKLDSEGWYTMWYLLDRDSMPSLYIEDGWRWNYDWVGVPWGNSPEILAMRRMRGR